MTTPINYQRKKQFAGKARQVAAARKRAAKLERDEVEMLTSREMKILGMRRSLAHWRIPAGEHRPIPQDYYLVIATCYNGGEQRRYSTKYYENIKYIGNTDFVAYGREHTCYQVYKISSAEPNGNCLVMTREAGHDPNSN